MGIARNSSVGGGLDQVTRFGGHDQSLAASGISAASALNLPSRHRFLDVIGPQLLRVALPSAATYAIGLLKDTAISSTIGVNEIAFQAYHTSQRTFHSLDIYAIAGALYILISLPMAWATRWADVRLRARVAR